MVPGLAFLYSGLARRKSALSLMWACMAAGSIITFQWYFWGYSLTFSASGKSGFIGDLKHFGMKNVLGAPSVGSPLIPDLLYAFYQVSNLPSYISITFPNPTDSYNSAPSLVPSLQVLLLSEADSYLSASGCSFGLPWFIIQSPAGHGIRTDGLTSMVSLTMLEVALSKLVPLFLLSPIQWFLANVQRR